MERASVSDLKKSVSGYFKKVKAGEEVLITDRGRAFAKIIPLRREEAGDGKDLSYLETAGLARVGKGFSPNFWDPKGPVDSEGSLRAALTAEREER